MTAATVHTGAGFEMLRAVHAGTAAPPPAAVLLGLMLDAVEPGRVVFSLDGEPRFGNPLLVHGGVIAAVADFAASAAALTVAPDDTTVVTTDLHVSYLRPARLGARLLATGTVVHVGRTQLNADVTIDERDGAPLARSSATFRVVVAKP